MFVVPVSVVAPDTDLPLSVPAISVPVSLIVPVVAIRLTVPAPPSVTRPLNRRFVAVSPIAVAVTVPATISEPVSAIVALVPPLSVPAIVRSTPFFTVKLDAVKSPSLAMLLDALPRSTAPPLPVSVATFSSGPAVPVIAPLACNSNGKDLLSKPPARTVMAPARTVPRTCPIRTDETEKPVRSDNRPVAPRVTVPADASVASSNVPPETAPPAVTLNASVRNETNPLLEPATLPAAPMVMPPTLTLRRRTSPDVALIVPATVRAAASLKKKSPLTLKSPIWLTVLTPCRSAEPPTLLELFSVAATMPAVADCVTPPLVVLKSTVAPV